MADAEELVLVVTTVPDDEAGERLARALVEERRIACANLLPGATSVFRWEGEVRREAETVVLMKTRRARVPELFRRVAELHPYDVPELVALPVERAAPAYCGWVLAETADASAAGAAPRTE